MEMDQNGTSKKWVQDTIAKIAIENNMIKGQKLHKPQNKKSPHWGALNLWVGLRGLRVDSSCPQLLWQLRMEMVEFSVQLEWDKIKLVAVVLTR